MNKRFVCFIITILLIVSCMACSKKSEEPDKTGTIDVDYTSGVLLKEKLDVPDTVEGEYASESGLTRVYVDAKVVVPEVSRVDVIEALPRVYTDEEVLSFYESHKEDWDWTYALSGKPYDGGVPTINKARDTGGKYDDYEYWIIHDIESEEEVEDYRHFYVSYGIDTVTGGPEFLLTFEYFRDYIRGNQVDFESQPLVNNKAADCTISLEEAIEYADKDVKALLPDYELTWYGQTPVSDIGIPGVSSMKAGQYYSLKYSRNLNGVSVNVSSTNVECSNDYGHTAGIGVVSVVVDDTGVIAFSYRNPYDTGNVIEEDVQLLPWDDIMDIFSKVSVLSIQSLEAYEEIYQNDLEVYEIRLGYMTVLQGDNTYRYTPVWDFYARYHLKGDGAWAGSSDLPPTEGASRLTINAIDGTIIDRNLGY